MGEKVRKRSQVLKENESREAGALQRASTPEERETRRLGKLGEDSSVSRNEVAE